MSIGLFADYNIYLDEFIKEHDFLDEDRLFWAELIESRLKTAKSISLPANTFNGKIHTFSLKLKLDLSQSDSLLMEELSDYFLSRYLVWRDKQKGLDLQFKADRLKNAESLEEWICLYEQKLDILLKNAASIRSTKAESSNALQQLKSHFSSLKIQPGKEALGEKIFLMHLVQFLPVLTRRIASISEYREKEVCEILLDNLFRSFLKSNTLQEMVDKKREQLSVYVKQLLNSAKIECFYSIDDVLNLGRLQIEAQEDVCASRNSNPYPLLKLNIFRLCRFKFHEYDHLNNSIPQWSLIKDASLDSEIDKKIKDIWQSLGGSLNPRENSDNIPACPETIEQAQRYYELYVSTDLVTNESKAYEFSQLLEKSTENGVLSFLLDEVERVVESRVNKNLTFVSNSNPGPKKLRHAVNSSCAMSRGPVKGTCPVNKDDAEETTSPLRLKLKRSMGGDFSEKKKRFLYSAKSISLSSLLFMSVTLGLGCVFIARSAVNQTVDGRDDSLLSLGTDDMYAVVSDLIKSPSKYDQAIEKIEPALTLKNENIGTRFTMSHRADRLTLNSSARAVTLNQFPDRIEQMIDHAGQIMLGVQQQSFLSESQAEKHFIVQDYPVTATWYGHEYDGKETASGESFDSQAYTVASSMLPFNSKLLLIDPESKTRVVVRVNDVPPSGAKLVISEKVAEALNVKDEGFANLQVGYPVSRIDTLMN